MSTLKEVGKKALVEKAFFEALVANRDNPAAALTTYGMSLNNPDLARLKGALMEPFRPPDFNLVEFITRIHKLPPGLNPFAGWDTDWDLLWIPLHGRH